MGHVVLLSKPPNMFEYPQEKPHGTLTAMLTYRTALKKLSNMSWMVY